MKGALAFFALLVVSLPAGAFAQSDLDITQSDGCYYEGDEKLEAGDFAGAIACFDEALRLHPKNVMALNGRGSARSKAGDFAGAIADYSAAIRIVAKDPVLYYNRGCARYEAEDFAGALEDLDRAIRLASPSQDEDLFSMRGLTRLKLWKLDGAVADFAVVVRLCPDSAAAQHNLGWAKLKKGDAEGAIAAFSEAIRIEPGDPGYHLRRGQAKELKGDFKGAIADRTRAIEISPKDGTPVFVRANTKFRAGVGSRHGETTYYRGAVADYTAALRLFSREAAHYRGGCYVRRGLAKALLGDRDAAVTDLECAAELGPENPYYALWIAGLTKDTTRVRPFARDEEWPGSIARLYVKRIKRGQLIAEAGEAPSPKRRKERLCEAHAFAGLLAEALGYPGAARKHYEACVATGLHEFTEHMWARGRLHQMTR